MSDLGPSFPRLIAVAMRRRGVGLRQLCRQVGIDPSLFSKILAGKRNPPTQESVLRRLADALQIDPVEVIVSAGLIPTDWHALWSDSDLLHDVHEIATQPARHARAFAPQSPEPLSRAVRVAVPFPSRGIPEELL